MLHAIPEIEQLERLLNSTQLAASPSLSRLLRYIVEETLAGRSAEIREYTLGVSVFDRGVDFNPRMDPIVRVQARNLRNRLAKYYMGPGAGDPIRIELPKGTYVPLFLPAAREGVAREGSARENAARREARAASPAAGAPQLSPFATSIMPVPPPRSPVAEPRVPRFWIAAVILLAMLVGFVALYLTQNHTGSRVAQAHVAAQPAGAWGILGG